MFISGINLRDVPQVQVEVARNRLATVTSKINTIKDDDNSEFRLELNYECTEDLAGITDVYVTLILDENTCDAFGKTNF